jgi:hypothetical protein
MHIDCMTFDAVTNLLQKQLHFLTMSDSEQTDLMKKNYVDEDPNSIMENVFKVQNLLPMDQWSEDRLKTYFYIATGVKGIKAQFIACKLLLKYENWTQSNTQKYILYQDLLISEQEKWDKMDKEKMKIEKMEQEEFFKKNNLCISNTTENKHMIIFILGPFRYNLNITRLKIAFIFCICACLCKLLF